MGESSGASSIITRINLLQTRRIRLLESITVITLLLRAIKRVAVQDIFDRDPYESRRSAMKGSKLLYLLVVFQLIKSPFMRGLVRATQEHKPLREAIAGEVA